MPRLVLTALVVSCLALGLTTSVRAAPEQNCASDPNCVCSETFQGTTLIFDGVGTGLYQTQSTPKGCSYESDGRPISRPAGDLTIGTDAEAINALPAGSTARINGRFLRGADGTEGIFFTGHDLARTAGSGTMQRFGFRWYRFYPSYFTFADERNLTPPTGTNIIHQEVVNNPDGSINLSIPSCRNSKWLQSGPSGNLIFDSHDGPVGAYGWSGFGWTPDFDCCFSGSPGASQAALNDNATARRGSWIRHEVYFTNPSGGSSPNGFHFKLIVKNVTKGTPEYVALDSTVFPDIDSRWLQAATTSWRPPARMTVMVSNNYRQNAPFPQGTCTGYEGLLYHAYYMWATDSGQRIGAAAEIEAGGGGPTDTARNTLTGGLGVTGAASARMVGAIFPTRSTIRVVGFLAFATGGLTVLIVFRLHMRRRSRR